MSPTIKLEQDRDYKPSTPEIVATKEAKLYPDVLADRIAAAADEMLREKIKSSTDGQTMVFRIRIMAERHDTQAIAETTVHVFKSELNSLEDILKGVFLRRITSQELLERISAGKTQMRIAFSPNWQEMGLVEKMADFLNQNTKSVLLVLLDTIGAEDQKQESRLVLGY